MCCHQPSSEDLVPKCIAKSPVKVHTVAVTIAAAAPKCDSPVCSRSDVAHDEIVTSSVEVCKRVNLDHAYCLPWTIEFAKAVDPAFFSLLDEVEGQVVEPRRSDASNRRLQSVDAPVVELGANPSTDNWYVPNRVSSHSGVSRLANRRRYNSVSYPPSINDKHNDLNLLLQCLTNVENESSETTIGSRKRSYSATIDTAYVSDISKNGIEVPSTEKATCGICKKMFLDWNYLRKHYLRMHGTDLIRRDGSLEKENLLCFSCSAVIDKDQLDAHTCSRSTISQTNLKISCDEHNTNPDRQLLDSASLAHQSSHPACLTHQLCTCQFCGMRMRKVLLDKHINQKHNLQSGAAGLELGANSCTSESSSETLSGSERVTSSNILRCPLCVAVFPRSEREQHVRDVHNADVPTAQFLYPGHAANSPYFSTVESRVACSSKPVSDQQTAERLSTSIASPATEPVGQYMLQRYLTEHQNNIIDDHCFKKVATQVSARP